MVWVTRPWAKQAFSFLTCSSFGIKVEVGAFHWISILSLVPASFGEELLGHLAEISTYRAVLCQRYSSFEYRSIQNGHPFEDSCFLPKKHFRLLSLEPPHLSSQSTRPLCPCRLRHNSLNNASSTSVNAQHGIYTLHVKNWIHSWIGWDGHGGHVSYVLGSVTDYTK